MLDAEPTVLCLAIRVRSHPGGEIDTADLERFLDRAAGTHQWLMTTEWLFAPAPVHPGMLTVPVICPEAVALRLHLEDCESDYRRVLGEHVVTPLELRRWRWVASQVLRQRRGQALLPWEIAAKAAGAQQPHV